MSLSDKYGIPEEKIQKILESNATFTRNLKIVYIYKEALKKGKPKLDAVTDAAEFSGLRDRQIYNIIKKFE